MTQLDMKLADIHGENLHFVMLQIRDSFRAIITAMEDMDARLAAVEVQIGLGTPGI